MRNGGSIEEVADDKLDGNLLHSVVIPLMANNRIAMCGGVNPYEISKFQYYLTTAGTRQSFAFDKLQEVMADMAMGKSAFSIGSGYELPCMHGQLDIDFVNEQKESPTFSPLAFAREYESVWTGSSDNSFVSLDDLNKCRTISIAEDKAIDKNADYILAYDVSRAEGVVNANCALVVFKIIPRKDGTYRKYIVNIFSFEGTHFREQALFIKQKVNEYKARMVVIDANGLGIGLIDDLVIDIDENPVYGVVNDDRFDKYKTPESIPMIYAIKSQRKETRDSDINNVFMSAVSNHNIKLLKSETSARSEIFKNKRISSEKLASELQPYIMTDLLCEEIMNLEYKQAGTETKVKQISRSIPTDKFRALSYGLFYIHLLEKKNKIKRDENIDLSKFLMIKKPSLQR